MIFNPGGVRWCSLLRTPGVSRALLPSLSVVKCFVTVLAKAMGEYLANNTTFLILPLGSRREEGDVSKIQDNSMMKTNAVK